MVNDGWHECLAPDAVDQTARDDPDQRRGRACRAACTTSSINRAETIDGTRPHHPRSRAAELHARFLPEAPGIRGAAQGPHDGAERHHRGREAVRTARPRRGGIPDRPEVAVRRQEVAEAALHLLQRRRERAGHVQGPSADGAQSAPPHRGVRDFLLRHRIQGRLHLHPRRVPARAARARGRDRGCLQGRISRPQHPRVGVRLRRLHASRRRRLRGWRGDRAHRVARRQARAAAHQAAVPCGRGPLRLSDGRQQR